MAEDRIPQLLKTVVDHFDQEDKAVRERQILLWRKLKLYWDGFSRIYFSEVAHDWRVPQESDSDQEYYDKPVNVFRAYLESIIAALSIIVPGIKCLPDDADNPLDISTAKAGDKIAELVYKHNDVILLWVHALYIWSTEGLVACHNYEKEDEKFGTYPVNQYEDETQENSVYNCPECQTRFDEFDPSISLEAECSNCGVVNPNLSIETSVVKKLVGVTQKPKSRQILEAYGGLYVKVPNYAMKQEDIPSLIFSYETHYTNVLERYDHLKKDTFDKLPKGGEIHDSYEQWGRLNPQYQGEYPTNNVTVRNAWLRTAAFNILEEADAKLLKEKFPHGAACVFVNDIYCESRDECLDDHWTLTKNPLADYLHHDPAGLILTSVQDLTNDIISLVVQTIEHGISQTFADPNVLNFDQYSQQEVNPGSIFPVKSRSGKALGESFFELKTATLSGEILPFLNRLQELGQLVSGALPSLFGGMQSAGSRTASEYSMSRAQALQRLQTPWKMLTVWWKEIFGKVIPAYMKCIEEDERIVERDSTGSYVNSFIKKADLEGKIGDIELEASEQLPITWAQKSEIGMKLFESNNPLIVQALTSPENINLFKSIIGLPEFKIPNEEFVQKQHEEIQILLNSAPYPTPDGQELPSVEVDPMIDNHLVEADICRRWLVSEVGRQVRGDNPEGYKNVLLHLQAHMQFAMPQEAQGAPPTEEEAPQQGVENG